MSARVQPKLTIGAVNDPLEQKADVMADKVMARMTEPSAQQQTAFAPPATYKFKYNNKPTGRIAKEAR